MSETKSLIDAICDTIDKMAPQLSQALPKHIPVEKFIRSVKLQVQMNEDLAAADRPSLFRSVLRAAQDGLQLDGREAALVVFNSNIGTKETPKWAKIVQYMPMVAGILKKIRNSGELSMIATHVVYDQDSFDYWLDDEGEHIMHRPKLEGERGKPVKAYCVAKTKDGARYIEVMSVAQVEKARGVSKASKSGPWVQWWDEMAEKTVLRKLAKRLPMSTDLDQVIRADDELIDLDTPAAPAITVAPKPVGRPSRLQAVDQGTGEITPPPPATQAGEPSEHEDLI